MRTLAVLERIPMAKEQAVGDDGFDLRFFFGFAALGDAIQRSAIGINISRKSQELAVRRPDEFADAFGRVGDFARVRAISFGYVYLRRSVARRQKCDLFAIR